MARRHGRRGRSFWTCGPWVATVRFVRCLGFTRGRSAVAAVTLAATATAALAGAEVRGTVVDALSAEPLASAVVSLSIRSVRTDAVGAMHLGPVEGYPLGTTETGTDGSFAISTAAVSAQARFGAIAATAPGYEPGFDTLVALSPSRAGELTVALVPLALASADRERLEAAHAARRDSLRGEPDGIAVALEAFASSPARVALTERVGSGYPVPEEVFVVELGEARFTGYVAFDELVAGTVAAEMGDGFPFEALRAQALAARTYALERFERTGVANGGQAYASAYAPQGKSAVAAATTHARVVLAGGEPITAFYSARCNGDRTLDSEDGLSGIVTCVVGGLGVGSLPYARSRPCSGHVSCALTTEPCCTVAIDGEVQHLYGHGVGLCQRGAEALACRDGFDGDGIVARYYSDVEIVNPPALAPGSRVIATVALNTREEPCTAPAAAVPAGSLGTVLSETAIVGCATLGSCSGAAGAAWSWRRIDWDDGPSGRWSVEDYLLPVPAGACGSAASCEDESCAPQDVCDTACERCAAGACASRCGRPLSEGGDIAVSDVLFVLQAAVGIRPCDLCVCDTAGSGRVDVTDALLLLDFVVGGGGELSCPGPDVPAQ